MTNKSKRTNLCEFLTTCAPLAVLLAASILTSDYLARPAYSRNAQDTLRSKSDAGSKTTRAIATGLKPADMFESHAWAKPLFSRAVALPISFVLDDKAKHGIPKEWRPAVNKRRIDNQRTETVFEGTDPKTSLQVRVECTEYHDYPVIEWVAWFNNKGQEATPIIRDILALDATFHGSAPVLYSNNGDFYSEKGYTPSEKPLGRGVSVSFAPNGGRPSDGASLTIASFSRGGDSRSPSAGRRSGPFSLMERQMVSTCGQASRRPTCG